MMKMKFFAVLLFLSQLYAEEIRSIVLIGSPKDLMTPTQEEISETVSTRGVDLPGSLSDLQKAVQGSLEKGGSSLYPNLKKDIYAYFEENGRPFVIVSIPSQDTKKGVLQVVVEESRLGNISVEGERYTSPTLLKKYIAIRPGEPIATGRLAKDVSFMNRNPFRRVDAVYAPGQKEWTTDIILEVRERNRVRISAGVDNYGIPTLGRNRIFGNISFNEFFGFDHFLFYQYTTNYDIHRFQAHTIQYTALLPNKTVLSLYGGYSIVHADISGPQKSNTGTNGQGSLRYIVPMTAGAKISQELTFGIDVKNTNNTLEFEDLSPTFGKTVNLTQAVIGYRLGYSGKNGQLSTGAEVVFSPSTWLPNQSNSDFESLRPGADNIYAYLRLFATQEGHFSKSLERLSYYLYLQGQISGQTLLPSEQLGLGGYGSVRGYDARQFNTDTGVVGNFEVRWDIVSFWKKGKDLLQAIAFIDGGGGLENTAVPTIPKSNFLIGTGPGLRYFLFPYLTARLDWGFKLHHQEDFTGGWSMLQFSVTGNY